MYPLRTLRDRLTLPALMIVVALATASDAVAQQSRRSYRSDYSSRIDTTFTFDRDGAVTLTTRSGDIVVNGWSRDQIHIRATSDDENLRLSASSSRVNLEVAGRGDDSRFEITVPYGVRVTATSQSGDIGIRGTRGQVEVRSNGGDVDVEDVTTRLDVTSLNGDITARGITGDIAVSTVSGGARLTDVHGTIDVGTVSGDIELRGITAKIVRAKTTSGDVTYDGTIDPAGRYEMATHSGDIRLRVPRDASAQLTVSTWNGAIDSDFPITLKPGEHGISISRSKRYTFEIGGGGARITADTFSGDITISSSGRGASNRP